jgi:hypothetical protein
MACPGPGQPQAQAVPSPTADASGHLVTVPGRPGHRDRDGHSAGVTPDIQVQLSLTHRVRLASENLITYDMYFRLSGFLWHASVSNTEIHLVYAVIYSA